MKSQATSTFAIIVGLFLLIEGIMGLSSPVVFEILSTNRTHAVIHILLGLIGIGLGAKGAARGYCIFLGVLLIVVGIFYFVPGVSEIIVDLLNVNQAVAFVNIVVGIVALLVAYLPRKTSI